MSFRDGAIIACVSLLGFIVSQAAYPDPVSSHDSNWTQAKGFDTSGIENPQDWHEPDWSRWIAERMGLDPDQACEVQTAYRSRIDILTNEYAIEVEHARKWPEAIGQSLQYAIQTGRQPQIILLATNQDDHSILECLAVCQRVGIKLAIQRVPGSMEAE